MPALKRRWREKALMGWFGSKFCLISLRKLHFGCSTPPEQFCFCAFITGYMGCRRFGASEVLIHDWMSYVHACSRYRTEIRQVRGEMFRILLRYEYVFSESTQLTQVLTASRVRTSSCDLCKTRHTSFGFD